MTLLAHLVGADLRRSVPLLCAWFAVAILSAVAPCVMPMIAGGNLRVLSSLEVAAALVAIAYPLVLVVLVSHVVHAHPLVGTTAFWMTRPIPPGALLASKLLVLGAAAILAPIAIEAIRMMAHGVPWTEQIGVTADTGLSHALLLAVLMFGAAVTANLLRFVMLIGATLMALAMVLVALAVLIIGGPVPQTLPEWSEIPDPTRRVVETGLLMAVAACALTLQYFTRFRARVAIVAIAGAVGAVLMAGAWPWPVLRPANDPPDWARRDSALRLTFDAAGETSTFPFAGVDGGSWLGVRGPVRLAGIEPGYTARVGVVEATLQSDRGTVASYRELRPAQIPVAGEPLHPALAVPRAVLRVERLATAPWWRPELPTLFVADGAALQEGTPDAGHYRGRLRVALQRYEIEAVVPVSAGARHHRGAYRVVLDVVQERFGNVSVQAHESMADSSFDWRPATSYAYYLRNEALREAIPGTARPIGAAANALRFLPFGISAGVQQSEFTARELLLQFSVPENMEGEAIVVDATWLAGAELVIVRMTPAGTVERELEIPDFRLDLPARVASSGR